MCYKGGVELSTCIHWESLYLCKSQNITALLTLTVREVLHRTMLCPELNARTMLNILIC